MQAPNKILTVLVLRIPRVKYEVEQYLVNSGNTSNQVLKQLKADKNVIDFIIPV
jgi:uncharacterized protein YgbK (DUF1537 family)